MKNVLVDSTLLYLLEISYASLFAWWYYLI